MNSKVHAVTRYIKTHFLRPVSQYLRPTPKQRPIPSSPYVGDDIPRLELDFGAPTTGSYPAREYRYDTGRPASIYVDGFRIAHEDELPATTALPYEDPWIVSHDEMSFHQSEVARGKQPLREPSPLQHDPGPIANEVQSQSKNLPDPPATAVNVVQSNGHPSPPDASLPTPHAGAGISAMAFPNSDGRLAEMKRHNRLLLAEIRQLEQLIVVIEESTQLLATDPDKQSAALVQLVDLSIPVDHEQSEDSPPDYLSHQSTPPTNTMTASNELGDDRSSASASTSTASKKLSASSTESLHTAGEDSHLVNGTDPVPEPSIEQKVANFLEAARLLRIALDDQAVWLADKIDAQADPEPLISFNDFPIEKKTPIVIDIPIFLCGVCLEDRSEVDITRVDKCGHNFCRDCIRSYVTSKIKEQRYPILCPTCVAERGEDKPQGRAKRGLFFTNS